MFIERARVASELAERALFPADPLPADGGVAVACDLYRQSVHWALCAHQALGREANEPPVGPGKPWESVDLVLLGRAFGTEAAFSALRTELLERSFVELAELPEKRQRELTEEARTAVRILLEALEPERKKAERLWFRRALFAAVGALLLLGAVFVVRGVGAAMEARRDLAAGAKWTTSSHYSGGCTSPQQECTESPDFFFHTLQEDDPWLVLDLRKTRQTSSVVVRNRGDCCAERAVPLVVELSTDNKNWTPVATQTGSFETWRASYPQTRARYVRLRVSKPASILHLKSVRVLP